MTLATGMLIATLVGGLYMAWNIGANDVANAMGTSVGSGALTLRRAIILAAVFEFGGAVLVGSHVTNTIRGGIVDISLFETTGPLGSEGPLVLALGMFSALLAAGAWLHLATHFALPVSTTHSIVGAVVGVGLVSFGLAGVQWAKMVQIVASWFVSPVLGAVLAFLTFTYVRRRILRSGDPVAAARRVSPWMIGIVGTIIILSFIYKVLGNVMEEPPFVLALAVASAAGAGLGWAGGVLVRRRPYTSGNPYTYVERIFALLQIATACFVAFAHGANDVANAVAPLAAVVNLARAGFTTVASQVPVPFWVLVLGGAGIVFGLATLGYKVIATIGKEITEMTPTRGFSAEFGAATTVLIASRLGLPVSTTHTLVGGVIGVGLAQGIGALNLRVVRNIVNSWLATVPAAALIAAAIFILLRFLVT